MAIAGSALAGYVKRSRETCGVAGAERPMRDAEFGATDPRTLKTAIGKQLFGDNALCPKRQSAGSINRRQAVPSYAKSSY
jgi:hypothetical protein